LPLASAFFYQIHRGKTQPIGFPVTTELKDAIKAYIENDPGRTLLLIGRPGIMSDENPIDVVIIISSEKPLPRSFAAGLTAIVRDKMENPDTRVRVACVADAWAEPASTLADAQEPGAQE